MTFEPLLGISNKVQNFVKLAIFNAVAIDPKILSFSTKIHFFYQNVCVWYEQVWKILISGQ